MTQLSVEANNKDTLHTSVAITSAKGMRRVLRQVFYQLQAPVVEKMDNAIHWINAAFEQLGPEPPASLLHMITAYAQV